MTNSKLRKKNKISSLLVHALHKTLNKAFSRRSRAKTRNNCTKKCEARAKLLFCLLNVLFFDVLVAVRIVGSLSPYYSLRGGRLFQLIRGNTVCIVERKVVTSSCHGSKISGCQQTKKWIRTISNFIDPF